MDRIYRLELEIETLKNKLRCKERELQYLKKQHEPNDCLIHHNYYAPHGLSHNNSTKMGTLPKWAIERYSRQILLPNIGVEGQEKLCVAKVLVVGAGGLGCPAAAYLAGAGVGEIGIVDSDTVDITNIHRQILHSEGDHDMNKAVSAATSLKSINSRIKVTAYRQRVCTRTALELLGKYDLVLDCTDNVATRYLLGDACAILKIPLVSGSALKMEGQLSVYSYRAAKNSKEEDASLIGPCYRCVFPVPPPLDTVGSCSTHGVAGPVPGMIGCLQALEAIKLIAGQTHERLLVGRMLIFDGEDMTARTVTLRPRNRECAACSGDAALEELMDYETFCTTRAKEENPELQLLPAGSRITAQELAGKLTNARERSDEHSRHGQRYLVVDVRSEEEYRMCCIDGTVNYPLDKLYGGHLDSLLALIRLCSDQVTFVCRRGNDSQIAVMRVLEVLEPAHRSKVRDLEGGLHAWAESVDHVFPVY